MKTPKTRIASLACLLPMLAGSGSALLAADLKPPVIGGQKNGLAPAEAVKGFGLYEGFRVVTSAAEPDVSQPVAMTIDERGRVWVAEAYEYPLRAEGDTGKDRILIFEDQNGDGVFDHRKVFAEGLNLVSGLEVGFGGVWVGAAPYLMFIPDKDGDDRPDGKPEILLDGFGWHDTHETLNSFIWGPDGWLYGCHGVFTHSKVGKPGTPEDRREKMNAAVWRFHPVRKNFEVFSHGTSNPWGLDFNDHGQAFITACVIPHLFHVIQGARYQRQAGQHFDPYTYEDIKTHADHLHYSGDQWQGSRDGSSSDFGGGHAHCGLSIYLGDNFPDQFRGKLLFNNLHGHRVNQEKVEREGSGYVGRHMPDFLFSNDRQHMGVTLRYGPDGGMYLSDWYDAQTCHTVNGEIWNRGNGRIYKITYGQPEHRQVDLRKASDVELVDYQLHRNDWFPRNARRLLQERAAAGSIDPAATAALWKIARQNPDDTRRLRALWALHGMGAASVAELLAVTGDASEYVRGWTVQLLLERRQADDATVARLADLAKNDPSPLVRLYLAAALQRIEPARRWELASALLAHGGDSGDHNLPLMDWYGVSDLVPADPARALVLAEKSSIPKVRRFLVRRLAGDSAGRDAILALAAARSGDSGLLADLLGGLGDALAKERGLPMPAGWQAAAAGFEKLADGSKRDFQRVATVFGDARMVDQFRAELADKAGSREARLAALENLQRASTADLPERLRALAADAADPLRSEWVRAYGASGDSRVPAFLMERFSSLDAAGKAAAVQALASTRPGAMALAKGLADSTVQRGDISAFTARQMRGYENAEISAAVEKYWGVIAAERPEEKLVEIRRLKAILNRTFLADADLRKGREVFQATCFACHQLFGEGTKLGPDLTGSNRGDITYLLENIIDPGSLVGVDYQLHILVTKDGRTLAGMLRESDANSLTVGMLGGGSTTVAKADIADHQVAKTSMMPEGLLSNLSRDQLRDLIGYLQSARQVPLPVAGEILVADDAIKVVEVTRGQLRSQPMGGFKADTWSAGRQLWWTGGGEGDHATLAFEAPAEGDFEVFAVFTKAHDYGTIRVSVNDETMVDSLDLFSRNEVVTTGEIPLGRHALGKEGNRIAIALLQANKDATPGNMFGIDHLRLVPVRK